MIKHPDLVGEPGGRPGIAGTKAPPGLDRFESFLVEAVEAQANSKVKMTESEVSRSARSRGSRALWRPGRRRPNGLFERAHIAPAGFHYRAPPPGGRIPVPDALMERSPRPSLSPIARSARGQARGGIERKRLFEQAVNCDAIGPSARSRS